MPTCEGCNRSSEEIIVAVLCEECSDKAGRFDITLLERNRLLKEVKATLTELDYALKAANKDEIICNKKGGKKCYWWGIRDEGLRVTFISQAIGRLKVAKHCCESR